MANRMPLPGGRAAALSAASAPPAQPEAEEMGESYEITPEEYAELGESGSTKTASGCTITMNTATAGETPEPPTKTSSMPFGK